MNFYNEHDPKAAAWLRELIRAGAIPPGDVDERSIADIQPAELDGYTQCHFFAGIAGWSLALDLAGWPADRPCGTGSCPCQPYSPAGKGLGDSDPRNLWPVFFRLIRGCRERGQPWTDVVFGEQVANAIKHGWLDGVCHDLEGEGYAVGAHVLAAGGTGAQGHPWLTQSADFWRLVAERAPLDPPTAARLRAAAQWLGELRCGPPHIRARLFWVAHSLGGGRQAGPVFRDGSETGDALAGGGSAPRRLAEPEHPERRTLDGRDENGHHGPDGGREETHGELGTRGEIHPCRLADRSGDRRAEHEREPGAEPRRSPAETHPAERGGAGGLAEPGCGSHERGRDAGELRDPAGNAESEGNQRERSGDALGHRLATGRLADDHEVRRGARERHVREPRGEFHPDGSGETGRWSTIAGGWPVWHAAGGLGHAVCQGRTRQPLGLMGAGGQGSWSAFDVLPCLDGKARRVESGTFPLAHGVPGRVGLLRGYGNAIVPQVAAEFIAAFLEVEATDL